MSASKSKLRANLLNRKRLDFDGKLKFEPLEAIADLVCHEFTEPDQVIERAKGCHVLISKELQINREEILGLPDEVQLICEAGTGYNNIDLQAAKERNITVCNVPGYSTHSVAHLTMSLLLALSTGLHRLIRSVEKQDYADFFESVRPHHFELKGKTLGVIGAGAIGEEVIQLARVLGMTVLVYKKPPHTWDDKKKKDELHKLLAECHIVTLHCPLTNDTKELIKAESINYMKKGTYLINTSRGKLINHDDLIEALESGHIAGAALDVQEPEPLPKDNVLWSNKNVILTPHIGWKAIESRQRLIEEVAGNIKAFIDKKPINVVSKS